MSGSILGPRGTPMVEMGGERAYKQFRRGGVVASLQWIDVKASDPQFEEDGPVPCMCLFHETRRFNQGAYVIPQVNAFRYALASGDGVPDEFLIVIIKVLEELGFDLNDKAAKHDIYSLVLDSMEELIRMPSDQPEALDMTRHQAIQGIEVTVRQGERVIHTELR